MNAKLRLAGAVGVPDGHPSAPVETVVRLPGKGYRDSRIPASVAFSQTMNPNSPTLSINSSLSGPAALARSSSPAISEEDIGRGQIPNQWPFKDALQSRRLVLVEDCSSLIENFPVRVWDELPNAAVIVPIANDSDEGIPSAVLVIGLSIRRPFDDDYESFIVCSTSSHIAAFTDKKNSTSFACSWRRD